MQNPRIGMVQLQEALDLQLNIQAVNLKEIKTDVQIQMQKVHSRDDDRCEYPSNSRLCG